MRKWKRPDSGQRGDAEFTSLERRSESLHQLAATVEQRLGLMVGRSSIHPALSRPPDPGLSQFGDKDSRVDTLGIILKRNEAITAIAVADTDYHTGGTLCAGRRLTES